MFSKLNLNFKFKLIPLFTFFFLNFSPSPALSDTYDVTTCKITQDKLVYSLSLATKAEDLNMYNNVKLWISVKRPFFGSTSFPEFLKGLPVEHNQVTIINTDRDSDWAKFILRTNIMASSTDAQNTERVYNISFKNERSTVLLDFVRINQESGSTEILRTSHTNKTIVFTNCTRKFQEI